MIEIELGTRVVVAMTDITTVVEAVVGAGISKTNPSLVEFGERTSVTIFDDVLMFE